MRRIQLKWLITPAVVTTYVAVCAAQGQIDPALRSAIDARRAGAQKRDPAAFVKTTADEYMAVNPNGKVMGKAEREAEIRAQGGAPNNNSWQVEESLRVYGTAAVQRTKTAAGRTLIIWAKKGAEWKVVAAHVIPDAAPPQNPPAPRPAKPPVSDWVAPTGLSADEAAAFAVFKQLQDTFFAGDFASNEKLTAPEFVRLSPGGVVRAREDGRQIVNGYRTPPKHDGLSVRVWDRVAVVRWHEVSAAGGGQMLTRVLAKGSNGWQQVVTASTIQQ